GLVESADEVFAVARIDAGLAADRGIDLGEERGGDLDETHAAPGDGRRKAREVADHAAAKGDEDIVAFQPGGEDGVDGGLQVRPGFGGFAGRQDDLTVGQPGFVQ